MARQDLLGKQVLCTMTGMKGTAAAKIIFMNGCVQYQIQPKKIIDGVPAEAKWYDEEQLEEIKSKKVAPKKIPTGGRAATYKSKVGSSKNGR